MKNYIYKGDFKEKIDTKVYLRICNVYKYLSNYKVKADILINGGINMKQTEKTKLNELNEIYLSLNECNQENAMYILNIIKNTQNLILCSSTNMK